MTNDKFLKENDLKAPTSWNDLLAPQYRTCCRWPTRVRRTAVTRIFSILEVNGRDETRPSTT
jgi:iron(III) transport system substrate-binding protein